MCLTPASHAPVKKRTRRTLFNGKFLEHLCLPFSHKEYVPNFLISVMLALLLFPSPLFCSKTFVRPSSQLDKFGVNEGPNNFMSGWVVTAPGTDASVLLPWCLGESRDLLLLSLDCSCLKYFSHSQ